jgi:hypothetical protein
MGWEPGYLDRPCINFRADRDCAVLGLLCNSVEHPSIGMSVCGRHVAGEMVNRYARSLLPVSLTYIHIKHLDIFKNREVLTDT